MKRKPVVSSKRDRYVELEAHIDRIDGALAGDVSDSNIAALLRERRMTLNAIESMVIVESETVADEVKAKRDARRAKVVEKAQ